MLAFILVLLIILNSFTLFPRGMADSEDMYTPTALNFKVYLNMICDFVLFLGHNLFERFEWTHRESNTGFLVANEVFYHWTMGPFVFEYK